MATNTIDLLYGPSYVDGGLSDWTGTTTLTGTASGTMIKQISLVNVAATAESVELAIHTTTPTASEKTVYKVTLSPGDSAHFEGLWIIPTTYELYARTTNASSVVITVHGMDMA